MKDLDVKLRVLQDMKSWAEKLETENLKSRKPAKESGAAK